jgi:hypothetical protein
MSVNISVSNSKQNGCNNIINKLFKSGINCRTINTLSIVDDNIESGCIITLGKEYNDKKKINYVWNLIKSEYNCSHLKIDGIFDGCINNYLAHDLCPGK